MSLLLAGCVAAPFAAMYAFTAATAGYTGYTIYKMNSGATASFQIERNDPSSAEIAIVSSAKRLAIYPSGNQFDGEDIDIFRASTDMEIVSSSETIAWVKKNRVVALKTLPSNERLEVAARLGKATRSDFVIMVDSLGTDISVNSFVASKKIKYKFVTILVDARSGKALWTEKQEVVVEGVSSSTSINEVNRIAAEGICSRLMDLRTGRQIANGVAAG